jgi:hypothetical protein
MRQGPKIPSIIYAWGKNTKQRLTTELSRRAHAAAADQSKNMSIQPEQTKIDAAAAVSSSDGLGCVQAIAASSTGSETAERRALEQWMREITDSLVYQPDIPISHKEAIVTAFSEYRIAIGRPLGESPNDQREAEAGSTPSTGSVARQTVEYWLQEERPGGWLDYARQESARIAFDRIDRLKQEKPGRPFRCIARIIKDWVLSPNAGDKV